MTGQMKYHLQCAKKTLGSVSSKYGIQEPAIAISDCPGLDISSNGNFSPSTPLLHTVPQPFLQQSKPFPQSESVEQLCTHIPTENGFTDGHLLFASTANQQANH